MYYAVVLGDELLVERISQKSTFLHIDGTFSILPGYISALKVRCAQILNIVAEYGPAVVSLFTVMMTGRKVGLYRGLYRHLKQKHPDLEPREIMADWEPALRKTAAEVWTDARIIGCW